MPTDFFTLDMLKTLAGMVACVILVVQILKNALDVVVEGFCKLFKLPQVHIHTMFWVVVISEILMFTVLAFSKPLTPLNIFLTSINALVVAASAAKAFESMTKSNNNNQTK